MCIIVNVYVTRKLEAWGLVQEMKCDALQGLQGILKERYG